MYSTSVFYFRCYKLGQVSKKMAVFSLPLRSLYVCNSFLFLFFPLLVRFFPQHQIFKQKRIYSSYRYQAFLISSCNLIVVRNELLVSHGTLFKLFHLQASLR